MIRVINPTDPEALEWVQAARFFLLKKENSPYLRVPVMRLKLIEERSPNLPTAGVDSSWRMYYNPEFMVQGEIRITAAIIEHEIWHLLRRHPERAKAKFVNKKTARFWNWAADAEIHNDEGLVERIRETGIEPYTAKVLGEQFGGKWVSRFVSGLLAEEYFDMIMEAIQDQDDEGEEGEGEGEWEGEGDPGDGDGYGEESEEESEDGGGGKEGEEAEIGGGNCGSSATGVPANWEQPPDDEVDKIDEKIMRKKVAKSIMKDAALQRGVEKGSAAYEWAKKEIAPPKVNWQRQLRSAVKNAIAFVSGSSEYTRRKLSRRQIHQPNILLPGMQHPTPEIAVVVDASGSMFSAYESDDKKAVDKYSLLDQALSETKNIVKKFGMGAGIKVYATDTTAYFVGKVFSPNKMKKLDNIGGGTDIGVGIEAAHHGRPRPQIIVVLTDGATPWPETGPPGTKVVVGLIGTKIKDLTMRHRWKAPPDWTKVIEIVD